MNQSLDGKILVTIERLIAGGLGMAHSGGRTYLVHGAAPGDKAAIVPTRASGGVTFAEIVDLIEASPVRVAPPCPHYGICGGCDFQHLSYQAQLDAKVEFVRDALRRIAGIAEPVEISITASPDQWAYRSRAEWRWDPQTRAFGYFERGSHTVRDVPSCPVLTPPLNRLLGDVRARVSAATDDAMPTEWYAASGERAPTLIPELPGLGKRSIMVTVADVDYQFDAGVFFQTNLAILPAMIASVLKGAGTPEIDEEEPRRSVAIDLYSGVGLFAIPLARRFDRVFAVETSRGATAFLRRNVERAGVGDVHTAALPCAVWIKQRAKSVGKVDVVVVDPPRIGVDVETLDGLVQLQAPRIVYVSCDPATLARDLKVLLSVGYRLDAVEAFDMFPQTHHVEIVAHLSLPESGEQA
ncbi:MAG: class I SAM-dependent RNA methyltransferase [Thermomicrobiales bacterium]